MYYDFGDYEPEWDEYDGGFVYDRFCISYCPWCWRKLDDSNKN